MDQESAQNNAVAKLPLLKQGDYEMWKLRIKQYFQVQDYALCDVIENGNSFNPVPRTITNADGTSTSTIPGPVTAEEKAQKKNDVKARSITNEIDTANIQVSTVTAPVSTVNTHGNTTNLSDATMYAFLANQPNGSQLVHEDLEQIHEDDLEEMSLKWQLALLSMRARRECKSPRNQESRPRNLDNLRKTVIMKETSSKAMVAIDRVGFDWSYMADDEVPTNMALMAFSDSESLDKLIGSQIIDNSRTSLRFTSYNAVAPPPTGLFVPLTVDLSNSGLEEFKQPKYEGYGPKAILTKSRIVPISTARQSSSRAAAPINVARPINTAASKPIVNVATSRSNAFQKSHSLSRRSFYQQTALQNKNLINTAKVNPVNTVKGKSVTSDIGKQGVNVVKSSTCWVWRPKIKVDPQDALKGTGIFDSGCSRHMKGNKSYLAYYQEYDGGFVAFAGSSKRGKITGKGKIRTGKLDFEDVYFVKELKFNLFSVSQMFSWVFFLAKNDEASGILQDFITGIENQLNHKVKIIRCDNRTEFKNYEMNQFCGIKGTKREFSNARTPQQNRVAKRKNRTLIDATRTMLADSLLPIPFWDEAVNTACYVQNKVLVTKSHNKIPYELLIGRTPIISFIRPFGYLVTSLNTFDHLGKFDGKAYEGFLVGYFTNSKASRVYNSRTRKVEENLHVNFLKNKPNIIGSDPKWLFDIDSLTTLMNYQPVSVGNRSNGNAGSEIHSDARQLRKEKVHDQEYILLPLLNTSSDVPSSHEEVEFLPKNDAGKKSTAEPTCVKGSKTDDLGSLDHQMKSINDSENINSINSFNTASLTVNDASNKDGTFQRTINIGIFDDSYNGRDEGAETDYNDLETMEPKKVTRDLDDESWVEAMQEELLQFKLLNMEPKKVTRDLDDESWVEAMQEELLQFKLLNRGIVVRNKARLVAQGHRQEEGIDYDEFFAPDARIEAIRFQMSSIGELTFFLRLQVEQRKEGIFLSHDKYVSDILEKFGFSSVKSAMKRILRYLKGQPTLGLWYPEDLPLDLIAYSNSDYAGASLDRKSTIGGYQFLGLEIKGYLINDGYADLVQHAGDYFNTAGQTTTSKEFSNPLMAGSLPKTISTKFVDQHNMVAYLEKSDDNRDFHQIVDFLSSCSITYALTVSPTIYASYIEQFWNTASSKTINSMKQIHAIVDGKAVVISESSVRSDLLFDDEDGITCLKNNEISENLTLMGYEPLSTKLTFQKGNVTVLFDTMLVQHKAPEGEGSAIPPEPQPTPFTLQQTTSVSQTVETQTTEPQIPTSHIIFHEAPIKPIIQSPTTYQRKRKTQKHKRTQKDNELPQTSVPLNLEANEAIHQEEGDRVERVITTDVRLEAAHASDNIFRTQTTVMPNVDIPQRMVTCGSPKRQDTTMGDSVPPTPYDSPLLGGYRPGSDEGRLKLEELMVLCTTLANKVTTLENKLSITKAVYHKAFITLTKTVKNLETQLKQKRSKAIIHSSDEEEPSVDIEDSSKQGRMIEELDKMRMSTCSIMQETELPKKLKKKEMIQLSLDEELAQKLYAKELAKQAARQDQERVWDQVHTFIPKDSEIKKEVMKRAGFDLQQGSSKKQRIIPDEDTSIDAIPLATKPSVIVEYKIVKEGKISTYLIVRADGSTKRYTSMINLLKNIDREDLETLWKLVQDTHRDTRPEESYEKVLRGDLKVMFKPDVESDV
nr:putative ribonuclease H-like domain-containing protein [Tanacetum cinerariifolium]